MDEKQLLENAKDFCILTGAKIVANPALGYGTDGSVWRTTRGTAVKAFYADGNYRDELTCYLRLQKEEINSICGLAVPSLEGSNDQLMCVEMSIVQRPYLLDFGKVYIDEYPPYHFDKLAMANWHAEVRELFEDRTDDVHIILYRLQKLGIYYVDPKPANICF